MKKIKIIGISILSMLLAFTIFIAEESIRLNKNAGALPAVIVGRTKCSPSCASVGSGITIEYYGIGYKLKIRYYHSEESSDDNQIYRITSEEFLLFNKLRLWAWIS